MTHRAEDADPNVPWNFCGHVHEKYKVKRLNENSIIVNLCVEVWDYYPVAFKQISSVIATFLKEEKKGIQSPTESIDPVGEVGDCGD